MNKNEKLDGLTYAKMVSAGAANLQAHAQEINDLNVFPIPDGDTGDNMLLTMMGGVIPEDKAAESLADTAKQVSDGMLLSARGNSGVILSQFFEGMNDGFSGLDYADTDAVASAFKGGVSQAYKAVMEPAEGTILTVIREATEYACGKQCKTPIEFMDAFMEEAKRSLERTPELLPVLKKAGVVDSGGAGIIYIIDGMMRALCGESMALGIKDQTEKNEIDLDAFTSESTLEFGYCTEILLRLQSSKTDVESFDETVIKDYLHSIGDSIVTVKSKSAVKIHVHTMTPYKVLEFCQQFGEYLTVKIENMSLQHNSSRFSEEQEAEKAPVERKKFAVVAVAAGEGVKQMFLDRGADFIVDGGQSMNPSAEAFLEAFDAVSAETIFVLPNNSNIILTAIQAAKLYERSDVRVIESRTVGQGYASISMLDTSSGDTDTIVQDLTSAMEGVLTAEIAKCVRDVDTDEMKLRVGEYIGFVGKDILASGSDRSEVAKSTVDALDLKNHDICIVICGKEATERDAAEIEKYITSHYRGKEVYVIDGGQDIYDFIMIVE